MSVIDTLIYDRTKANVTALESLYVKAKDGALTAEEWAFLADPTHKGAYNYTDLNRVGRAIAYLAEILKGYGYAVVVSPKTNWVASDNPTPAQLTTYLADVATLRAALAVLPTTPAVPADMESLTVEEANDIEKILVDLDTVIRSMLMVLPRVAQPLFYCGFGLYPAHGHEERTYRQVCTADGLAVYTSDGLAVVID